MASIALESDTELPSDPGGLGPADPLGLIWGREEGRKIQEKLKRTEKQNKS